MKTLDSFVEEARNVIREVGYMSAVELVGSISTAMCDEQQHHGDLDFGAVEVVTNVPCDDIKVVEYATAMTESYRRKDLFYYSPKEINNV